MSSGNHAAAVALAAGLRGITAYIAMPETAPIAKRRAVEGYGGKITLRGANINEVDETARQIQEETGAVMIHPFDDPRVIAGQGTAALELLEDHPDLDAIIGPVSGGGLMSGTCIAAAALKPGIELFGAEPANADDAFRSLRAGHRLTDGPRNTIADGLRATLSERTFTILHRHLREILTVTEEEMQEEFLNEKHHIGGEMIVFETQEEAQAFYERIKDPSQWDAMKAQGEHQVRPVSLMTLEAYIDLWGIPKEQLYAFHAMELGSIGPPMPFGTQWCVYRLLDKRTGEFKDFPQARAGYEKQVQMKKKYEALKQWIEQLKQSAHLNVLLAP